jgi:hypothetical protein
VLAAHFVSIDMATQNGDDAVLAEVKSIDTTFFFGWGFFQVPR